MKIEKIKPIPKYIAKKIIAIDKKRDLTYNQKRFYAYFTKNDGELVKITVAARRYQGQIHLKQVAVHGIESNVCFAKDIVCHYIAGFSVGWYDMGLTKHPTWYEDGVWYEYTPEKAFDPYAILINVDYITTLPEFKYSAVELYAYENTLKYLRTYRQYPEVEFLTKLGLSRIALSKQILKLARESKPFRKWLGKNRLMLKFEPYDIKVIIDAFKTKKDIRALQQLHNKRKDFNHASSLKNLRAFVKGETDKFIAYIEKQNTNFYSYNDYKQACEYLEIDMTEDKNRYPHDFKRWHDIRIDEYHTAKALKDEQERKELYDKFAAVASKYLGLEYIKKSVYIAIIAQKPSDLINEGNTLHHCVGRMGYDQKFAREESLIFFIRMKDSPDVPLVTVEYSPSEKKVLQCYGDNDSKPNIDILNFVNDKWLPYANKRLKQIAAA